MTKKEYAKNIVQLIDNSRRIDCMDFDEIVNEVEGFLSVVQPVDRARFSKWGHPEHWSTAVNCWDIEADSNGN